MPLGFTGVPRTVRGAREDAEIAEPRGGHRARAPHARPHRTRAPRTHEGPARTVVRTGPSDGVGLSQPTRMKVGLDCQMLRNWIVLPGRGASIWVLPPA